MTDQEDTADKNEQELNLFSAQQPGDTQDEPEFAGFAERPEAGFDAPGAADTGEEAKTGSGMDAGFDAAPVAPAVSTADASEVVAPAARRSASSCTVGKGVIVIISCPPLRVGLSAP